MFMKQKLSEILGDKFFKGDKNPKNDNSRAKNVILVICMLHT